MEKSLTPTPEDKQIERLMEIYMQAAGIPELTGPG
jgi:hypothetical protein